MKFLVHITSAKAIIIKMGIWKKYDTMLAVLSNAHKKLKKCYSKVDPKWNPSSDEDGYLVDAFVNIPKKPTLSDGEDDSPRSPQSCKQGACQCCDEGF